MQKYTALTIDGPKIFKNKLKKIVEQTFDYDQINKVINSGSFTRSGHLAEQRSLWHLTPRQSGTSSSIAAMFDHENDVYVGYNYNLVRDFQNKFSYIQGKSKSRVCYALLNRCDLNSLRGRPNNYKRIFIDVGGPFVVQHENTMYKIKRIIEEFEKFVPQNTVYIIT